ncbi:MAG: hypothetical protein KF691_13875 [Phycisphaeraceae bacterium]|nr:hypothetical protein [Phycisphaeraceae bacterium]
MHRPAASPTIKRNWTKRVIGALICFGLPAAFAASLIRGVAALNPAWFAGAWWLSLAGVIAGLNIYLGIVRPWIFRIRNGSFDGFKWTSSLPVLGTLSLIPAVFQGWGHPEQQRSV